MKIIIIGGGAAGASCATRIRRLDEKAEILIIEKSNEVSIANCGLPYYISDVIPDRNNILISNPEKFKNMFNIDVLLNTEVVQINRELKNIEINNGEKISYDKLVLAMGATPYIPDFEGLDKNKNNIFTLRRLEDADKIKNYIKNNSSKKAVVLGGGFVGIEVAENLAHLGLNVSIVELQSQILAPYDFEAASVLQTEMINNGVNLILGKGVKYFSGNSLVLDSDEKIDFDILIMAIGVKPEIELAKKANLEVGRGIIVNEFMRTVDENIYSAGDSTEAIDFVSGINTLFPLAGPANRQGRIIADNICGINSIYKKSQGASVIKVFGLTSACVGNNEKQLKQKNIPYWKTFVFGSSHASYYPNSNRILYKLLFNSEGQILGAQGVGKEGVEKRIDVISSVMRMGGTVSDLIDMELCYAPPYSSAKDPVNILGMNAENILRGFVKPAYYEELDSAYLIDVRPPQMFNAETIEGAINLPVSMIRKRLDEIPRDKKVILFCNTGYTSYVASRIVLQNGFNNVYSFMGGIELYKLLKANKLDVATI